MLFNHSCDRFLKYLFCVINFFILSNYTPLFTQSVGENIASRTKEQPTNQLSSDQLSTDQFKALVETIYYLLLTEHSDDEIIEMFDDDQEYPYNMQKLVAHIHELLNKYNSKDHVVNIIVDNKESKEYFARKNFLTKMKICYFVLKALAALASIAAFYYLFYKYFKCSVSGLFGFIPGEADLQYHGDADNDKKADASGLSDCDKNCQLRASLAGQSDNIQQVPQAPQELSDINQSNPDSIARKEAAVDRKLYEDIMQQFEAARSIGFASEAIQSDVAVVDSSVVSSDNRRLGEILEQQIAQAISIGLLPPE